MNREEGKTTGKPPPLSPAPLPVLNYASGAERRSRLNGADFLGAGLGAVITLTMFAFAAIMFVGMFFFAHDGSAMGLPIASIGFAAFIGAGLNALATTLSIALGSHRRPQSLRDPALARESIRAIFAAIVGIAMLLALLILVASMSLADDRPQVRFASVIAVLVEFIAGAGCVGYAGGIVRRRLRSLRQA